VVEYDLQTGCNVLNRRRLAETAAGTAMTFHLAGASSVIHFDEDFANAWKTTVEGLTNVLEICGGRIVFPSTASIYGGATTPLEERRALPDPVNAYAKTKLQCEQLCFAANKDVRVLRIRVSAGLNLSGCPRAVEYSGVATLELTGRKPSLSERGR
jgi:nucleoside-diphosphate-sugar epimerase